MSWEKLKPVYGKLPINSGNWQGNSTVEILTGYWDDLLCGLKNSLDNPNWLSYTSDEKYLDYIGKGLCGYGSAWDFGYSTEVKRRLIQNAGIILRSRGSRKSLQTLIDSVIPGSKLIHFPTPRSDLSYADLTVVSDYPTNRYMILLPLTIQREGKEWKWISNLISSFMPIGEVKLQYMTNLPNLTIAGDWSVN